VKNPDWKHLHGIYFSWTVVSRPIARLSVQRNAGVAATRNARRTVVEADCTINARNERAAFDGKLSRKVAGRIFVFAALHSHSEVAKSPADGRGNGLLSISDHK
jgi:hypothetical protein